MKRIALISFMFPPMSSIGAMRPLRMAASAKEQFECAVFCATPRSSGERKGGNTSFLSLVKGVSVFAHDDGAARLFENINMPRKFERVFRQTVIKSALKKPSNSLEKKFIEYLLSHNLAPEKFNFVWMVRTLKDLEREHARSPFSLIVASNPPFENVILTSYFCTQHSLPYVLDFRDLYSNNPFLNPSSDERSFELEVLNNAQRVIAVTKGFQQKISQLTQTPVSLIYNGYISKKATQRLDSQYPINILYAGILYDTQYTRTLIEAICETSNNNIHFDFYGISLIPEDQLPQSSDRYTHHGYVGKDEILSIEQSSELMLVIGIAGHHEVIPAKTYEVLSLEKPAIYIGSQNDEGCQILKDSGLLIGSAETREELVQSFDSLTKSSLRLQPNACKIDEFSFKKQSSQFLKIFSDAMN